MSTTETKYDPNGLIDAVSALLDAKNDAELSRKLKVQPPVLSNLRHHRLMVGATFMIKCHEIGTMSFPEIRAFVGGQP